MQCYKSRDSSVGIALGYGLDDQGSRVRFLAGAGNFSLHHRVQNGSGAHPPSYPMGTRCSFPGVKRPGREADHSPPSSAEVKEWAELYLHFPNTPSWRGAQLKHRDNFTFMQYCIFIDISFVSEMNIYRGQWSVKIAMNTFGRCNTSPFSLKILTHLTNLLSLHVS
jgi:hypothetical protein